MQYTQEMAEKIIKAIEKVEIKVDSTDKDYMFDVVATTQDVDRDHETILVDGRDTKNWERNPVVLINHDYEVESIVGKGTRFYTAINETTGLPEKRLEGIFSKTNPVAQIAKDLYKEGMLNAVSVGFIVKQRNSADYKIIEQAELLEVSFVAIPCNPNALSTEQRKIFEKAVEKGLAKEEKADEPTVTPCTSCGCESCKETKELLKAIKANTDNTLLESKRMADDNAKMLDDDGALERRKTLQSIDKTIGDALRSLKKIV